VLGHAASNVFPAIPCRRGKTFPALRKKFPAIWRREMPRQPFVSGAKYPADLAQAALIFSISLFSSLLAGKIPKETGSRLTGSSAKLRLILRCF
jgi:hypothetical protein